MSNRYKGGVISATPPTLVAGAGASGTWTLEQQMQATAAGLWPVNGPFYIEDVFSTYLYTATGPSAGQTITNGIDLSTKGGMVWIKNRTTVGTNFATIDTVRGATKEVYTDTNGAQSTVSNGLTAFTSSGFTLGIDTVGGNVNYAYTSPTAMVSWTFRKQPKFFDVVTWTGDASGNRVLNHALTSTPACIIIKATNAVDDWYVYHTSLGTNKWLYLNTTSAEQSGSIVTAVSSTTFTVSQSNGFNTSGRTYVAYLFAHNAGGFGLTGTDNVISCGSFTTNGSGVASVTLDYEPQFVLVKRTDSTSDWFMMDNMRGLTADPNNPVAMLRANLSNAENTASYTGWSINATGFGWSAGAASATYIYIAIRRGPMKVPTSGTSVFAPALGVSTTPNMVAGFPVDSFLGGDRDTSTSTNWKWWDRLRGNVASLLTTTTAAEDTSEYNYGQFQSMTGFISGNYDASDKIGWLFRRAPSFFDEVCYTGTGSATTFSHNLGAVPEMMIGKSRSGTFDWCVYHKDIGNTKAIYLNGSGTPVTSLDFWNDTTPTSSVFTIGTINRLNTNGNTQVMYLFATCAGVSKVGSYTGTATTLQVDCGFTGGARFVLIKRTDSTGDWYVWDSARGIVSGNDPYLLLNSTAAEVTNTDYVDTYSAGFEISSTAPAAINANGGTFIFLAIA